MRVLFIGCVESSYILLKELLENNISVCGVVTKKISNYNADFKDIRPLCQNYNIDLCCMEKNNDHTVFEFVKEKKPDIIYCFGWSHLLKSEVIKLAPKGAVGFHPAQLPMNRGRHPIIWALVLGLEKTASTFFMIDTQADCGDLISQVTIAIEEKDDARSLYNKVMKVARKQVLQITNDFIEDEVIYLKQDNSISNSWRKRSKEDGKMDFRMSSTSLYNLIRALTKPYIGAHFSHKGIDYKVWSSKVIDDELNSYHNIEPGKVVEVRSDRSFIVKTGDGLIQILDCEDTNLKVGDYL